MKLERRSAYGPGQKWTKEEETRLLKYLRRNGNSTAVMQSMFPERSIASIRSKVRKMRIKYDLFGNLYRDEKEDYTREIGKEVKPQTVFDAYAGVGHQTFIWAEKADHVYASERMANRYCELRKKLKDRNYHLIDNDLRGWEGYSNGKSQIHIYRGDAIDAAASLRANKITINLVDLDTCGSTIPTLPTFMLLLKPQHLVITHGEFQSLRFKREDVLRRLLVHRDIAGNELPKTTTELETELEKATKLAALRAHNETTDSFWLDLVSEKWMGGKKYGILRRHYCVSRPIATSDCINSIAEVA